MTWLGKWFRGKRGKNVPTYDGAPRDAEWEHAENWSGHWARCRLADGRAGTGVGPSKYTAQRLAHREAQHRT